MTSVRGFRWLAAVTLLALAVSTPGAAQQKAPSGSISVEGWRLSFIGSIGGANGTLRYGGRTRKFDVTGLGIGGFGISSFEATGTVYDLTRIEDFVGTYANIRSGITVGDQSMGGPLWLQNEHGVRLEVKPVTQGLQLNLGADGLIVTWDD